MILYLCVIAGGAIGSAGRYWMMLAIARTLGWTSCWSATLLNIVGSFIIGVLSALTLPNGVLPISAELRSFVLFGVSSGFATAAFCLQALAVLGTGRSAKAVASAMAITVALCIAAVVLGHMLATHIGTRT